VGVDRERIRNKYYNLYFLSFCWEKQIKCTCVIGPSKIIKVDLEKMIK
jgi:hypothetical protein